MEKEYLPVPQEPVKTPLWIESGKFNAYNFTASDEEGNNFKIRVIKDKSNKTKVLRAYYNRKPWAKLYSCKFNRGIMIYGQVLETNDLIILKQKNQLELDVIEIKDGWPFYNILIMTL